MREDLFIEEKEDEVCSNCIYFYQQDDWCEIHNCDTEPYDYCPSFDDDWEYIKRQEMSEQIKRAIEWFRLEHAQQEINYESHPFKDKKDEDYIKVLETVLECLQSELDRQENKALTLSELKERAGKPVWVVTNDDGKHIAEWEIVSALNFDVNDVIIEFKGGWNVEYDYCQCYKHKPTEGGGKMSEKAKSDEVVTMEFQGDSNTSLGAFVVTKIENSGKKADDFCKNM